MGASKQKREAFFKEHPFCIFCGGEVRADTVEHCPPRAMFQHRQWPEGFEFPSCLQCNAGSSDDDLLVAMLARMDPFTGKGNEDGKLKGLMWKANRQFPGMFAKMRLTASQARRENKEHGIVPEPGQTHQEAGGIRVTEEMHRAVGVFSSKLTKGIYYKEERSVFPTDGRLYLRWFTNVDALKDGKYPVFEILKELDGVSPNLSRSSKLLNDQFEYKYSPSDGGDYFILQVRISNGFGMAVFGSRLAHKLDEIMSRIRHDLGGDGGFAVLS